MESADESASYRKPGKRDECDERDGESAVQGDADIRLEKINKQYPARDTAVKDNNEAFDGNEKRRRQVLKPR